MPTPARDDEPEVSLADKIRAKRRIQELPPNTPMRGPTGRLNGAPNMATVRCTEPGCGALGAITCQHDLGGKLAGTKCGRTLCLEHAGLNNPERKKGTPVVCGPHGRHPEARGR